MGKVDSRIATYEHIGEVRKRLNLVIKELINRAADHDQSKLVSPSCNRSSIMNPERRSFFAMAMSAAAGFFCGKLPVVASLLPVIGKPRRVPQSTVHDFHTLLYLIPLDHLKQMTPYQIDQVKHALAKRHGADVVRVESMESVIDSFGGKVTDANWLRPPQKLTAEERQIPLDHLKQMTPYQIDQVKHALTAGRRYLLAISG